MIFEEYLLKSITGTYIKMVKIMKLLLFLMVFVNVYIHFSDMVLDAEPSSYGSGFGTLELRIRIHNTDMTTYTGMFFFFWRCFLNVK
jgi:hypothetical protein